MVNALSLLLEWNHASGGGYNAEVARSLYFLIRANEKV